MKISEIFYCIFMGVLIFNLLILHLLDLINANYVTILFLVLLMVLPFLPKIGRIYFGNLAIDFISSKEAKEIKEETEQLLPESKFEEIKEKKSELDNIVDELIGLGEYDFHFGLVAIRLRLEQLVREIFNSTMPNKLKYKQGIKWSLRRMSKRLEDKKIIDAMTYGLLKKVINICNRAVHGFKIEDNENSEIFYEIAIKLVAYFYNLNEEIKSRRR